MSKISVTLATATACAFNLQGCKSGAKDRQSDKQPQSDKELGNTPWPEKFPTFMLESKFFISSIKDHFTTDFQGKDGPIPKEVFTIDQQQIGKSDALIIVRNISLDEI